MKQQHKSELSIQTMVLPLEVPDHQDGFQVSAIG